VAMAFSPCGQRLVVVTGDNRHTVSVYAWRSKQLLHQGVGHNGQPPQVITSSLVVVAYIPSRDDCDLYCLSTGQAPFVL
jgi:hypothetical protein